MRNEKLIPFEVIEKAVAGEPEAIDAVLRHYTAHIKYLSMYKGHINDDTQDRLKAKLVEARVCQVKCVNFILFFGGHF
ncbi:MAG: helix-turn-helix domain-containing protein [Lachnospiraceae bacterium]|nr:helix-turn-helix domain-containing protein [Lachnospiraceae bacterium]